MSARARARYALLALVARAIRTRGEPTKGKPSDHVVRRVLLLRPDHLGDLMLTAPSIGALRSALPDAELVLAVGPWNTDAALRLPGVTRTIEIEFPGFTRRKTGGLVAPYRYLHAVATRLAAQNFDAAVILRDDHWWGGLLAAAAGIPIRIGYVSPELALFLTRGLPLPDEEHMTRASLRLCAALAAVRGRSLDAAVAPGDAPVRFATSCAEERAARALLAPAGAGRPAIAIHPGSGAPVKLWEDDRWATVIDAVSAAGYSPVLTGTPPERALAGGIAAQSEAAVLNLTGRTTVGELAAVFKRCVMVMGPDSGALHLAVAVGTPTMHLFGPASARKFGPWGPPSRHVVVDAGMRCSRCGVLSPRRPRGAPCMLAITTEQVLEAAFELLRTTASVQA